MPVSPMPASVRSTATPSSVFWRSDTLPFIEAREVVRGQSACFAPHSHATFSVGVITGGRSTCVSGPHTDPTGTGMTVVLNPEQPHACAPDPDTPWAYRMMFLDVEWLSARLDDLGDGGGFRGYATRTSGDARLFQAVNDVFTRLTAAEADALSRQEAAATFATRLHGLLGDRPLAAPPLPHTLRRAADFITDNCTRALSLAEIAAQADLSPTQCIRAFRQRFGLTPHAYLTNRRIQFSQQRLRQGAAIADVALEAGFADQAHFQRTFKRLVAMTPGRYQAASR